MTTTQDYIPGMCNINKDEIAYRKKAMWFGVALTVVLLAVMLALSLNVWVQLLLFVPIYIAAIGYLQSKNKFCVAYGASGKQNATDGNAAAEAVVDKKALAADKAKARKMNMQAAGISIVTLAVIMVVSASFIL